MADKSSNPFAKLFEVDLPASRPIDLGCNIEFPELEPRTLEDDGAFMQLLDATRRSVEISEESARIASASDRRSRTMLAVGIATLLVALLTLGFAVWSHFNPATTPSDDARIATMDIGSRNTQSDAPALPNAATQ